MKKKLVRSNTVYDYTTDPMSDYVLTKRGIEQELKDIFADLDTLAARAPISKSIEDELHQILDRFYKDLEATTRRIARVMSK